MPQCPVYSYIDTTSTWCLQTYAEAPTTETASFCSWRRTFRTVEVTKRLHQGWAERIRPIRLDMRYHYLGECISARSTDAHTMHMAHRSRRTTRRSSAKLGTWWSSLERPNVKKEKNGPKRRFRGRRSGEGKSLRFLFEWNALNCCLNQMWHEISSRYLLRSVSVYWDLCNRYTMHTQCNHIYAWSWNGIPNPKHFLWTVRWQRWLSIQF